ncbi:MAG: hypothetical protein H6518_00265 [Microthrixaceae bacterium]|nr:hypothetical protein [Microthrixaceae bacterium]
MTSVLDPDASTAAAAGLATALAGLDPADVVGAADDLGLDHVADTALVSACAAVVDRPKAAPPDSFVLHAPLELMARGALLARVAPAARRAARLRLVWFAATYAGAGAPAEVDDRFAGSPADVVVSRLVDAVAVGDLDAAGAAGRALARAVPVADLVAALVDVVAPSLAAAAHGGIWLHQVRSFAGAPAAPGAAAMARELARHPDWRLTWFDEAPVQAGSVSSVEDLVGVLRRPPSPGPLDVDFIHPTMHLVESAGLAAGLLGPALDGVDRHEATRALWRVGALSMLQDDPDEAPYGWSHCLTMPHGLLSVAGLARDPQRVLAAGATYVLGFRATQGKVDLDPDWAPGSGPVAEAWHAPAAERPAVAARLAGHAAAHPDAHLAKYTLACLQLADADPSFAHGYLAAAAHLNAWWDAHPVADDPLMAGTG